MNYRVVMIPSPSDGGMWWLVKDLQDFTVALCYEKHNAELICKLLNAHT